MSEQLYRYFMLGMTVEEIVAQSNDKNLTVEKARTQIEAERKAFEDRCLRNVMSNAAQGDIPSVEWLMKRGMLSAPSDKP